ncbi:formimidoylglutamate deiminase [Paracoccus albus]|uniref:formimidoylglutamate deiminase n=1 Tax=Paracoccus albus TaxID=3017784 RepID=UPI0022F09790|nr:formimidoylglutamate deiminase [Paracoccus albus]WBU60825.1 formimidoylglutamate deiminase [Paracoccus albus]
MESRIFTRQALLPGGWESDVTIHVDSSGNISAIETDSSPDGAELAAGPLVPTMTNLHSHAFQRAMAGLAEVAGPSGDSFWTWREQMYRCVTTMTPDDIETVATMLQIELLKGGFGHVAEFHYQHHGPQGQHYDDPAEASLRHFAAAEQSGIGLTLLPVFYAHSDFGGQAPTEGQRPFLHDTDDYLSLLDRVRAEAAKRGQACGCAIHSLRAATPQQIDQIIGNLPNPGPIHIHIAEQMKEVEASLKWSGRRPVEWLLDEQPVDKSWCLIHATHLSTDETRRIASSGAVVGLCPMTEANLGDGIFPARDFQQAGGAFGIGTDSHVSVSVAEELRMLEYSQRLRDQARNCLAGSEGRSTGRSLFEGALAGGHRAAGVGSGHIAVGAPASWVVLDDKNPFIATAAQDQLLDRWIFALGDSAIRDVYVWGRKVINNRHHPLDDEIAPRFAGVLRKIST